MFLSAYVLLLLDISPDRCFLGDGPGEIGQVRSFSRIVALCASHDCHNITKIIILRITHAYILFLIKSNILYLKKLYQIRKKSTSSLHCQN